MDAAVTLIVAASGLGGALERIGIVVAALLAAGALLAPSTRARGFAALAALVLTPVLLVADIWDSPQLVSLRDRPALGAAALALALAAVCALAWAMRRRPELLPLLAVAALPFRIPISAGGETANLLVPLYLVIAAGVLASAIPAVRAEDDDAPFRPRALEWLLLGSVVLYAVQSAYADDVTKALQNVVFFYVPFALLFGLLREVRWTERVALRCLGVLVALAVIFVLIGFWEYANKELLLNPKVISSNQLEPYFRVNSLFFDPNVYGRFLATVMLALATIALWTRRPRVLAASALLLVLLWGGLILTFSQSSIAALLAGLAVLAALRWSVRWTLVATAVAVLIGVGLVVLAPKAVRVNLSSAESADRATSGRIDLLEGGVRLFADRPILGWGSGTFAEAFREREKVSSQRAATASHTIPITVAAEQGVIGLAVYLALLAAALARLFAGARGTPLRAYVAAAFVGLLVHTLLYAAFLEDPLTWALLAVGTALAVGPAQPPAARAAESGAAA